MVFRGSADFGWEFGIFATITSVIIAIAEEEIFQKEEYLIITCFTFEGISWFLYIFLWFAPTSSPLLAHISRRGSRGSFRGTGQETASPTPLRRAISHIPPLLPPHSRSSIISPPRGRVFPDPSPGGSSSPRPAAPVTQQQAAPRPPQPVGFPSSRTESLWLGGITIATSQIFILYIKDRTRCASWRLSAMYIIASLKKGQHGSMWVKMGQ